MTYPQTLAAITTHARTAAGALPNPITDVAAAFPSPRGRCVRIFWGGEVSPEVIGAEDTLTTKLVGQRTIVMGFWPLSNLSEAQAAVIEAEAQAFVTALRTAIHGDFTLGNLVAVESVGYTDTGFADLAGAPYRTTETELISDFDEYNLSP